MINKKSLLYIVLFVVFYVTLMFSWYEGSEVRANIFEWGYSTPFTNAMNNSVNYSNYPSEISNLDHFVYAAKFKPLFPLIMFISIFLIISIYLWNQVNIYKLAAIMGFGVILLLLSVFNFSPSTIGGKYFSYTFVILGLINIAYPIFILVRKKNIES
ncbi:DUF4306 domain-containing protein [Cytobacillus sp. FSL K6-0265]|uniref:DUF4306 domain-containing protein n=1 Tax=Cytobacillus sp. FSL K6-0265 TaxID=2921448 RepID=UPI0030FBE38F